MNSQPTNNPPDAALASRITGPRPGEATPFSVFWLALWLAVAMTVTKALHLGLPWDWSWGGLLDYGVDLAIMSHADVLFAIAIGLAGHAALCLSVRRPASERAIRAAVMLLFVLCVVYAIVSVQIFAYLRTPLTYPLIYLAGDMKNMRSSLGAFVTLPLVTGMVAGPPAYLLLAWTTTRLIRPRRGRCWQVGQAVGLAGVVGCCVVAHKTFAGPWSDREDRRIAESPHWVLVTSLLAEWTGERAVQLDVEFPSQDVTDFQTAAKRPPAAPPTLQTTHRPKNVIVYVLESVGTHYLGLYGSDYRTTPRLEAEAASSLVCDNFYAHVGVTANSLVAITLSIYPGMSWREFTVEQPDLPGVTLAELFHARGDRTAFLTSGDIEWVNIDRFLQHRGFHILRDYRDLECTPLITSWGVEDRCLVDSVIQWIDQARDRPFFVTTLTQQTHHPYEPSRGQKPIDFFRGHLPLDEYDLGRYLNVLLEADRQLGRLFDWLRASGLADDTLVVITGDHGEGFGWPHKTYGHGAKVYEELVHVPLMLWNPVLFSPGGRSVTIGSHIDINPTVLDLLGLSAPGSWQGRSLFDGSRPPRAYFYAANDDYLLGVREQQWKYIYNATVGREELFDLDHDGTEQTNLAGEHPDACRRLRQRVAAWMKYEEGHLAGLRRGPQSKRE